MRKALLKYSAHGSTNLDPRDFQYETPYEELHRTMDEDSALTYIEDHINLEPDVLKPEDKSANIANQRYASNRFSVWTDDEVQFVAEAYPYTTDEALARLLNKPTHIVTALRREHKWVRDRGLIKFRPPIVIWADRERFDEDIEKYHLTTIRPPQGVVKRGILYRDTTRDVEEGRLDDDANLTPESWSWFDTIEGDEDGDTD